MSNDKHSKDDDKLLYCSFCGKSQQEVRKLIAGPSVYICDECVDLCNDIIKDELLDKSSSFYGGGLPKPKQIKAELDAYVIGQERAKRLAPQDRRQNEDDHAELGVDQPIINAYPGGDRDLHGFIFGNDRHDAARMRDSLNGL